MERKEFMNNYWSYYLMLEHKFIDTLNFVELCENNYTTNSREFASLMQLIGAELDSFFKIYCGFNPDDRKNIKDYAGYILQSYQEVKVQKIIVNSYNIELTPFDGWDSEKASESLHWWKAYNDIKHSRTSNYTDASLKNALSALSALYLMEMKYLSIITEGKHQPDIPDVPSKLFTLANRQHRWLLMNSTFGEIIG